MSVTLYIDIRAALTNHLKALPGLPEVAYENKSYNPIVGQAYIRPALLWGESFQAEQGPNGRNWECGVYQLSCVCPADKGAGPILVILGQLKDHFKRGTELSYNGVVVKIRKVHLSGLPPRSEGPNYEIPLSISFYCQADN